MQKDVDPDINSTCINLGEARNLIIQNDMELGKCKMEITKLSENTTSHDGRLELEHQLEYEEEVNKDLVKKLWDQIFISKKTELAFNTQTELVSAKNEKVIIEQLKKEASASARDDLTSHIIVNNGGIENKNKNGVQDCSDYIKVHAANGVLLLWADIQRKVTPENIWIAQVVQKFDSEEITEAKELLWRIAGDSIIGKMVKRQGANKPLPESNDIGYAFKSLSEKDSLPMFLCTGDMVVQTTIYTLSPTENASSQVINTQLKTIQESINYLLGSLCAKQENTECTF